MTTSDDFAIRIDWQGGACPYQAEGVIIVNGVEYLFYFRYRSDHARIAIYRRGHEEYEEALFRRDQRKVTGIPHNGYMEDAEAGALISRWADEFVEENTWYCEECHEKTVVDGKEVKEYFLCSCCGESVICLDCWNEHCRTTASHH